MLIQIQKDRLDLERERLNFEREKAGLAPLPLKTGKLI